MPKRTDAVESPRNWLEKVVSRSDSSLWLRKSDKIPDTPTSSPMKSIILAVPLAFVLLNVGDFSLQAAPESVKRPRIIGSSWLVEDIDHKGVIDDARTFIHFDTAEKVSGSGGVNHFNGLYTLDGDKLAFGALAATRMAGAPAVMAQEASFLKALAAVRSCKLDENDLLHFCDSKDREILRMSRSDEKR